MLALEIAVYSIETISFPLAGFLAYAVLVLVVVFILMVNYVPQYGQTHVMVYIGICSLVGSLSVCRWHSSIFTLFIMFRW